MTRLNSSAARRALCAAASAAALAAGAGAAGVAHAEAAAVADAGTSRVEEVIVTAERRSENLQAAPLAITAFTNKSLEARGVTNLASLTTLTPNLELRQTTRPAGGSSTFAAFVRGVGTGDYQFPTDPAVGLYVDGVYLARTIGGLLSLSDVDHIEVLKGPQGTLFGRNTLGGAVTITTLKPILTGAPTGSIEARVGSYGRADILGVVRAPLIDNVLGMKLSLASIHMDGYEKQIGGSNVFGTEGRIVGRAGLLFQPNDKFSIDLNADYTRQRQVPTIGNVSAENPTASANIIAFNKFAAPFLNPGLGLPAGSIMDSRFSSPDTLKTYETDLGYDRNEIGGASVTATYVSSPALTVKSITALRSLKSEVRISGDSGPYAINETVTPAVDRQYSEELELSGRLLDDRLNYVGGAYYFHEVGHALQQTQLFHGLYESTVGTPNAKGVANVGYALDSNTYFHEVAESYAAFAQATFAITPTLNITAGARITKDKKDYLTYLTKPQLAGGGLTLAGSGAVPLSGANHTWTSTTPKLGVDWHVTSDIMLYASYSEGFKSGSFGSAANTGFIPIVQPETLKSTEVGFKSQWFDHRLTLNAAAFDGRWEDVQITIIQNVPIVNLKTLENGGNVHVPGYEIELEAVPIDNLRLNLGVGHNRARFTAVTPEAVAGSLPFILTVGTRFPYVPDTNVDGGAQYTWKSALGDLTIRGDFSHKSDLYLNLADPSSYQPSYTTYSARISFIPQRWNNLEVYVAGQNLGDERYYVYKTVSASTGESLDIAGMPRTVNVGAKMRF